MHLRPFVPRGKDDSAGRDPLKGKSRSPHKKRQVGQLATNLCTFVKQPPCQ
jgi:hypothetical protein